MAVVFARTGRPGQQDQTAGLGDQFQKLLQHVVVETQRPQVEAAVAGIEDADDDFFSPGGGEDGDALLAAAQFRIGRRMAFLRQAGLVGYHVAEDFEAAGNLLHQVQRQVDQFGQHAVEADAHGQRAFPRLDVNVAGLGGDGVHEQIFDQRGDFRLALGGIRLQVSQCFTHGGD